MESILDYPGSFNVIARVVKSERERQSQKGEVMTEAEAEGERERKKERGREEGRKGGKERCRFYTTDFQNGGKSMGQKMQVVSRSWKGQGKRSPSPSPSSCPELLEGP